MREVIIGVFRHSAAAQRALEDLRDAGFTEEQIGLLAHEDRGDVIKSLGNNLQVAFTRLRAAEGPGVEFGGGGMYGHHAGGGGNHGATPQPGAEAWALNVATGNLSTIGSVVLGGIFAPIMDVAGEVTRDGAAGRGQGAGDEERGVVEGLIGAGITQAEARHYTREFARGRAVILVRSRSGAREVLSILGHHGSFERTLFRVPDDESEHVATG